MSSDIPGFYYDPVQQRYYRLTSQTANTTPSARLISNRARQEQLVAKQLDLLDTSKRKSSSRYERKKRISRSRLNVLRQREYGRIRPKFSHRQIRSNFLEHLPSTCFLEDKSSFSLRDQSQAYANSDLALTSSGQCIQLIDYHLYLNLLQQPSYTYQLQPNHIDGYRSSYFIDSSERFMSTTLMNDETHAIVRFLQFSSSPSADSLQMLANRPLAPNYYYRETCQTLELSSSPINHTSPLMIKCSGPCCYSKGYDCFALNINNYLYVYDLPRFQLKVSARVPIRRVTLSDLIFSPDNSEIIYTTNGAQFQQWDLRQSPRLSSTRIPILCSTIKCLQTKPHCILTSSFDERINLFDLRQPKEPLLVYETSPTSANNPHFTFSLDMQSEEYLAACSQHHLVHLWEVNSGRCLNRLRCPIPERSVHTATRCSIQSIDQIPRLTIYHPEYSRVTRIDR